MRMMPPTWGAEMDSCITQRCFRPIRLPEKMKMATATVTTPMPPIWIRSRITACPNSDQYCMVSWTTRPVTQVAEVAVNSASRKPAPPGARVEIGSISSRAPARMSSKKPKMITRAGEVCPRFQKGGVTPPNCSFIARTKPPFARFKASLYLIEIGASVPCGKYAAPGHVL